MPVEFESKGGSIIMFLRLEPGPERFTGDKKEGNLKVS